MNLKSAHIIDTGPVPAVYGKIVQHTAEWINTTDKTLKVWIVQVWQGMDIGGIGDFWFYLRRKSDEAPMALTNWDHYRDPTVQHNLMYYYAPNWFEIAPKDG